MDLREILFALFPAFFLLSLLFLIAHLRVRKHSAVKSVLWVLLFGAALTHTQVRDQKQQTQQKKRREQRK
jgi:hypothetical protein